jgi:hypothetical protein
VRASALVVVMVVMLFGGVQMAAADVDPSPTPTGGVECRLGLCNVDVGSGGDDSDATPVDNPGGDGGSGVEKPTCSSGGEKIPCSSHLGIWNGTCYVQLADPQPPKDDPIWAGHEEGVIVACTPHVCVAQPDQDYIPDCPVNRYWAPEAPGGGPDPGRLAERAVSQMRLQGIDIGIVPEEGPNRIGVVGMPTWMWVNEPAENTFGPITRSASAGGATVTATATVDRIVWDMGDGTTVTCVGAGTPYEDRYDISDSPDCGHNYTEQGEYEVTATSYWTVQWQGVGQSGTIPLDFTSTASIVMGEAQVITQ